MQRWPHSRPEAAQSFAVLPFAVGAKVLMGQIMAILSPRGKRPFRPGGPWLWSDKLPVAVRPVWVTGACGDNSARELSVRSDERWGFLWPHSLHRRGLLVKRLGEPHP